jgi:hypothetical protein
MWILRYLILATRQRCNANLDRRTRMTFDPLHGCAMYVCQDKAEWDRRGVEQVAQLESELRQGIEAYHTETKERRAITVETIEVRPVVDGGLLEKSDQNQSQLQTGAPSTEPQPAAPKVEETILPVAAPETEAAPVPTGDALVSSGVEAQAEAEPGADPTFLEEKGLGDVRPEPAAAKPQSEPGTTIPGGQSQLQTVAPSPEAARSTEVPEPTQRTEAATPKAKTKLAGKAGKK